MKRNEIEEKRYQVRAGDFDTCKARDERGAECTEVLEHRARRSNAAGGEINKRKVCYSISGDNS